MLCLENHQEIKNFIESLQGIIFPYEKTTFNILKEELRKNDLEISAFCDSYDDFAVVTKENFPVKIFNKNDLLRVSPKFSISYTLVERLEGDGYTIHFNSIKYSIYCHVSSYHFYDDGNYVKKSDSAGVQSVRFTQVPKNKQELEAMIDNSSRIKYAVIDFFTMFSTFESLIMNKNRFRLNEKFNNNNKQLFNFICKNFNFLS